MVTLAEAFKPLPRSSPVANVISEPPLPPEAIDWAPELGIRIPASTMPETVACACAPKTAAKAATATRIITLLVLNNNKSNNAIDFLIQ